MVNKKYLLLAAGFAGALMAQPAAAQESGTDANATYTSRDMTYRGDNYDALDSNLVPAKRKDQHRQFLNHQYNFPAKPRSQWELGVHGGMYNVSGDVTSKLIWDNGGGGFGFGGHLRKSVGYGLSLRGSYTYGVAKGLNWQGADFNEWSNNSAWNGRNFNTVNVATNANVNGSGSGPNTTPYTAADQVFYNYRMESHQGNIDLIASFTNIRFHKARTGISVYGFAGFGGLAYQTWVDALGNNNSTKYNFSSLFDPTSPNFVDKDGNGSITYKERDEAKKVLVDNILDGEYETSAQSNANSANGGRRSSIFSNASGFDKTLAAVFSFGIGTQFRINKRINLAIEDRVTTIIGYDEDLLDGQRYASVGPNAVVSPNKDGLNYLSVGLNFNLGSSAKRVEPLYWLNPLDYSYGEISNPRHMILPDPVLSDADGDGIADQFDKCPGTPAGVAVDSHGCPMDTDGDGVPDDRDKQLITPTECQPVDADGVGKCPCNCPVGEGGGACSNVGAGSLVFSSGSTRIAPSMQGQLSTLAAQMQANPTCRVVIMGNGAGSKVQQQRSWDRVNAVIEYMSERNGIDRNRFIFQYGGTGDENVVMYRVANQGEEGPSNQAPPFPNLRRD